MASDNLEPIGPRPGRRVKCFSIDHQKVLDVIARGLVPEWHHGALASFIYVLDRLPFPRDAKVVRVGYDSWNLCFGFMIEHESFPEVPDGCPAPRCDWGDILFRAVQVPTLVDDDQPAIVPAG